MNLPTIIETIVFALIALRVLLFERRGADHRPYAALLAYLITAAAGMAAILSLCGQLPPVDPLRLALLIVLCAALFAVHGNVVELFRRSDAIGENRLVTFLRKTRWF